MNTLFSSFGGHGSNGSSPAAAAIDSAATVVFDSSNRYGNSAAVAINSVAAAAIDPAATVHSAATVVFNSAAAAIVSTATDMAIQQHWRRRLIQQRWWC